MRVVGSDKSEGFGDGLVEVLLASGPNRAQVLFDLGPGLFDGIEVGRIGRQIEHFRSPSLDPFALCAKMSETSRPSIITVGRGKKSHFDKHEQGKYFFRCVGGFGA